MLTSDYVHKVGAWIHQEDQHFPEPSENTDSYREGERYLELYNDLSGSTYIGLIDKELCKNYKARVTTGFSGMDEVFAKWAKDKVAFSDLETRTTQYVVNVF